MDAGQRGTYLRGGTRVSFAVAGTGTKMWGWVDQGHGRSEERVLHLLRIQGVGVT